MPYEERAFKPSDLKDQFIVIVAVDDIKLQEEIFRLTRDKSIFVNAVDSPDYCDFIFPAYVKKGDVVIGITSSGSAPGLSAKIRKHVEKTLPPNLEDILRQVRELRESLPKGKERQRKILQLVDELFED
ncbi:MAG: bifunctional precorrin-2 dehydrogenase/sirohydrochlorin ferrochelatase [Persephonella sp.]|nr:bifunctional precorrin-2 dehydrogenase/sirohydrochlorin ferrochelatase [Persephonella sp.]